MDGFSVIICTYNGRNSIGPVLSALAAQTGLDATQVEVIVVDNASTDDTAEFAARSWTHPRFELKIVAEKRPGQAFAREAGYRAARHSLICWVDDDNILSPGYLARAAGMMSRYPHAAVCGGRGVMVSSVEIPEWLREEWCSHGCGAQGEADGPVSSQRDYVYFAGAIVRREALDELYAAGFKPLLSGRRGNTLMGGEDNEVCFALRLLGWQIIQSRQLTFDHIMPPQRLTWDYCLRLFYAGGQTTAIVNLYLMFIGHTPRRRLKRTWAGVHLALLLDRIRTFRARRRPEPKEPIEVLRRQLLYGRTEMLLQLQANGDLRKYFLAVGDFHRRCQAIRQARENP